MTKSKGIGYKSIMQAVPPATGAFLTVKIREKPRHRVAKQAFSY
jgi:hypothetical protein